MLRYNRATSITFLGVVLSLTFGLLLVVCSVGFAYAAVDPKPSPTSTKTSTSGTGSGNSTDDWTATFIDDGSGSKGGSSNSGGSTSGSGVVGCVNTQGSKVDCTRNGGWWNNARQCYVAQTNDDPGSMITNQRPKDSSAKLYSCTSYHSQAGMGDFGATTTYFWSVSNPVGGVSEREVADQAVVKMNLKAPEIGIAPPLVETKKDSMGIIGVPVWMWAANPSENTTGPITRSASQGDASVTATGTLAKTVWSMGDGSTVTCKGKKAVGTVWPESYHGGPIESPTCGYTYMKTSKNMPDMLYPVKVTAYWEISWKGAHSDGGTFEKTVTRSGHLMIGELKVLITK